jgi:crotonobetainyl-CoA:carnitine CoA-transferase CaiB-like acyl-CoA transferase
VSGEPAAVSAGEAVPPPLNGLRVVDLSTWIAGGYCTKLLADGGAEVIKIEPPGGDPLRRWSASGAKVDPDLDGALFNFLHTSKQSIVVDPGSDGDLASLHDLLATADVVVWSPGSPLAEIPALTPHELRRAHPQATVAAISPYGLSGPWNDKPATELTLQAWSGGVIRLARGRPDRPPTYVGGQVGEWLTGTFAAVGALASRRRSDGGGELVDVSVLESLAACLTYYPVTFHDQLGRPIREDRFVPTPGVSEARDGTVGLGTGTGQQWLDFCAMVERPDWAEEPAYLTDRTVLAPEIDAWVAERTVEEVLDLASTFRLPNAPVANGADVTDIEHFRAREVFVPNPRDGATNPRSPFRFERLRLRSPEPAPRLGEHSFDAVSRREPAGGSRPPGPAAAPLPFEGLRVLDMTAFWAGPVTGHILALLGAEVIHVESPRRPDGVRFVGGVPQTEDRYLERSPIFAAINTNKKSLGVDLTDERGVEVLRRFVATCDVVVENYTPRVLDQLGFGHETLRSIRPDLITVRMPGFGLDGPWRDKAAFAFVIEDASGLTWLSGHPDVPPIEPYSLGDPNAGLHALFGLQLALEHRARTGEGGLVEAAMVDAALNVASEQVIEHSAYGALLSRSGNRGPCAAPQNLYQVAGPDEYGRDDCWVAIAVATDGQWRSLRHALGDPEWATDPALATAPGRERAHDLIDEHLQAWCRGRSADEVVSRLWDAGVPVGTVVQPHRQADLPPFRHRHFFEEVEHPVTGRSRYSTLPVRFSRGPQHLHRRHAPLLGEHTAELLGDLGLSRPELDALEAAGIIGGPPAGATG